jgi:c-di-GMP-binding flagellar brake protein YcgR
MAVSNTEIITNRYHILSLLQRARATHAIVSLQRPHESFIYNSAILRVNSHDNCFILDTPVETELPLQARTNDWLKIRIKLQGLVLSFEAIVEESLTENKTHDGYRLRLPEQVNYEQRRNAFRASVGYQFKTSFSAQVSENDCMTGHLINISLKGACVEVKSHGSTELRPETLIKSCKFQIGQNSMLISDATIRSLQITDHSLDTYRIGIEFNNISATERRHLQRWVMKFDRENRKSALAE